jgi:hypothetical protein
MFNGTSSSSTTAMHQCGIQCDNALTSMVAMLLMRTPLATCLLKMMMRLMNGKMTKARMETSHVFSLMHADCIDASKGNCNYCLSRSSAQQVQETSHS